MNLPFKNPLSGNLLSTREASKNVQRVSKHFVDFFTYLKNETKLGDPNKIHIIGHGLGAHVNIPFVCYSFIPKLSPRFVYCLQIWYQIAGVVGFKVKHVTGDSVGRITGLDPSGPTHTYTALSEKLDKTDANVRQNTFTFVWKEYTLVLFLYLQFVDVLHTANGPFGAEGSFGHVDFYVSFYDTKD